MAQEILVSMVFKLQLRLKSLHGGQSTFLTFLTTETKGRTMCRLSIMPLGKPFKTFQGGEGFHNKDHSNTARKFILLFLKKCLGVRYV